MPSSPAGEPNTDNAAQLRTTMAEAQPKTIPNPLYCNRCEGRGYLVADVEWEPYTVQCPDCANRTVKFSQIPTTHSSDPALWDDE